MQKSSGQSCVDIVEEKSREKKETCSEAWFFPEQAWPSLASGKTDNCRQGSGAARWADLGEEAEWDLDSQLLASTEAREDKELGADTPNVETFGQEGMQVVLRGAGGRKRSTRGDNVCNRGPCGSSMVEDSKKNDFGNGVFVLL